MDQRRLVLVVQVQVLELEEEIHGLWLVQAHISLFPGECRQISRLRPLRLYVLRLWIPAVDVEGVRDQPNVQGLPLDRVRWTLLLSLEDRFELERGLRCRGSDRRTLLGFEYWRRRSRDGFLACEGGWNQAGVWTEW